MPTDDSARQRAERRRQSAEQWPVRAHELGAEPVIDPLDRSTVDERIAMMWPLARAAWSAAGQAIPLYERCSAPGRVIRGHERKDAADVEQLEKLPR